MKALFIGSTAGNSGKTLVTVGLGLSLKDAGLKVGYFKPLGRMPVTANGRTVDADAQFVKGVLGIEEPLETVCPVVLTQDLITRGLRGQAGDLRAVVHEAFERIAAGKDIVLVGGAGSLADGAFLGISGTRLAKELKTQVLLIDPYTTEVCVDCILTAKEALGDRLAGVVLNRVAAADLSVVEETVVPFLNGKGAEVLGVLPLDPLLDAVTVRQLTEILTGKVLCGLDRLEEFVERFSVGAMDVEAALGYFRKLPNKAVITGGHRPDIILAALETSTKCLILTGDQIPNELLVARAREVGVPMITVPYDTLTTVEKLEAVLGRIRIREEKKVRRARELVASRLDVKKLLARIGMA
jgi:BioD-like phosphotransacetylase family protein